jgi:hypothetical protein
MDWQKTKRRKYEVTNAYACGQEMVHKEELADTFWHEVVHAILEDMGQYELNKNEAFVTQFANRLTVAIKTAKFDD